MSEREAFVNACIEDWTTPDPWEERAVYVPDVFWINGRNAWLRKRFPRR